MKITDLKQQIKNENRVSVFVDGKYNFSLTISEVLDEKIKIGREIDDSELKRLQKISADGKLKMRVLEWLTLRPHSERELRDYLYRKKTEKEQIEDLVEWAKLKGYQNDETFARWFAEGRLRKNKSWRAVQAELRTKGVSLLTIQSIATEFGGTEKNDQEALSKLIDKLSTKPRYQDSKKLIAYLISKGFSYSDIKQQLENTRV